MTALESINDVINPSRDFNACQSLQLSSCLAVAAALPPVGGARVLPRLVSKLSPSIQRAIAFPTKVGAGGPPQFFSDVTGRYLGHLTPLWRNPMQFTTRLVEGVLSGTAGGPMPGAVSRARSAGQLMGQTISTFWPW